MISALVGAHQKLTRRRIYWTWKTDFLRTPVFLSMIYLSLYLSFLYLLGDSWNYMPPILVSSSAKRSQQKMKKSLWGCVYDMIVLMSLLLTMNIFHTFFLLLTLNRETFVGFILKGQTLFKTRSGVPCVLLFCSILSEKNLLNEWEIIGRSLL